MSGIPSNLYASRTVHVYRGGLPWLSCSHRLSGKFFALEDLVNLWRIEDGPELGSGRRLGGAGVHRIVYPPDDGAVE